MSSDPSPIRILAVDDHPHFRQGIAALVAGQPDMILVSEAANGREAIQRSLNAVTSDQLQSDWERKTRFSGRIQIGWPLEPSGLSRRIDYIIRT